jgi:hypothetical protein
MLALIPVPSAVYCSSMPAERPTTYLDGWTSPEILSNSPYALVGDTDRMVDTLLERRERWGLSYFTCWEDDIDLLAPVLGRLAET